MKFRTALITTLLSLLSLHPSFSQEGLLVKNVKTGKSAFYKKNRKITYATFQGDDYIKGKLISVNDSSITVNEIQISFKEIYSIQRKNILHKAARIAGLPFILIGCVVSGNGIAHILSKDEVKSREDLLIIGAAYLAIGFTPYFINLSEYVINEKNGWKIEAYTKPGT